LQSWRIGTSTSLPAGIATVRSVQDVEVVLFDLGGVLIDFGGVGAMRELAGLDSDDEVWRRWLACEWVRSFERGHCSPEEFAAGVVADWALAIDGPAFLAEFSAWLGGPLPGAVELVDEVRRVARVGCLSNTNPVHWVHWERWPFHQHFADRYLSFEIGMVKPDRELFDHVAEHVGVAPGRVVFLDDNLINVEGAREVGFQADHVRGPAEARRALVARGVLR
jgi:putative hydrolase of the HAD superfamily